MTITFLFVCMIVVLGFSSHTMSSDHSTIKLVALGTSLTSKQDWYKETEKTLEHCFSDGIEVHVIAIPGANSEWALEQLDKVVALNPTIVLIEFSVNDADIIDGVSLSDSMINHRKIVEELRRSSSLRDIFLVTTNPVSGFRGMIRPFLNQYYDQYRTLALNFQIGLIDTHLYWNNDILKNSQDDSIPDGLHPTRDAFNRVAGPELMKSIVASKAFMDRQCNRCDVCKPHDG